MSNNWFARIRRRAAAATQHSEPPLDAGGADRADSGSASDCGRSGPKPAVRVNRAVGRKLAASIEAADRLRDDKAYAEAAEHYRKALGLASGRTDIRVQYANMLKESGQLAEAEAAYRDALNETPADGDIYLQLGHALKLQGRVPAAIEAYRRAAELSPASADPLRELAHLGDPSAQEALFASHLRQGGVDAVMTLTHRLTELRRTLDDMIASLPDIHTQMAVPLGSYDLFRDLYRLPTPPQVSVPASFHIVLLGDREEPSRLRRQIAAVERQSFGNWTLSIAVSEPLRCRIAEEAMAREPRIDRHKVADGETAHDTEQLLALDAGADWVLLLAPGAVLAPEAVGWFAAAAARTVAGAFVCDEERLSESASTPRYSAPELRAAADYDSLLERNLLGETIIVRRDVYAAVAAGLEADTISMARSLLALALARRGQLGHLPLTLVCRDEEVAAASGPDAEHEEAVRRHLMQFPRGRISGAPENSRPSIAVIIPTRDNGADLRKAVTSLRAKARIPDRLHITVVDNGSREAETSAALEELRRECRVAIKRLDEPFNWSRLNNEGVEHSDAPLLLFANDDVVMLTQDWDEQLRGFLARPEIGAVGARLLYPDDTLQHAGMLFDWPGTLMIHDGLYESTATPGPAARWHVTRAVGAVTGAFLATRRDVFVTQGGFDAIELPVAFSDVDYAFKLRRSGLKVLWTPRITLYHHESKTRGLDHLDPEKQIRYRAERAVIERRWGAVLCADPGVNPLWHRATLPFRLLSPPSEARIWAHIERCANPNPWLIPGGPALRPDTRNSEADTDAPPNTRLAVKSD